MADVATNTVAKYFVTRKGKWTAKKVEVMMAMGQWSKVHLCDRVFKTMRSVASIACSVSIQTLCNGQTRLDGRYVLLVCID